MENGSNQVNNHSKKLLLASPRGFCAGVKRAIEALDQAVKTFPSETIYCYHQIVHNNYVVKDFEEKGVKFVNSLEEVPEGSILVFSSHGVSPTIKEQALKKNLRTIDSTCPFVAKTHFEVKKYASEGLQVLYIGQQNHDEAIGTIGEASQSTHLIQTTEDVKDLQLSPTDQIALVTQTTLSFDETEKLRLDLKKQFPLLVEPAKIDICMATQNRQAGVKELIKNGAKIIIVLGSANSSNSNKLKKVAEKEGVKAYLVDEINEVDPSVVTSFDCIGLTAGASLPENKIDQAINWFKKLGIKDIEEIIVADESQINLPPVIVR